MEELKHGFRIDPAKCAGRMECMRICPVQALRVKNGKAALIPERCIDCGVCLRVCPRGAVSAATLSFADLDKFKLKVAVPSSVLYSQFPMTASPDKIRGALLKIGFDVVYDFSAEVELVNRAIRDCLRSWKDSLPLISSSCPVVVRLVQVAYPTMVGQLLPIELPRELAGREVKRRFSQTHGVSEDEIAAVYITPCQAKTISIIQPAEGAKSHLDGAVGINEIYNETLSHIRDDDATEAGSVTGFLRSSRTLLWGTAEGQAENLARHRYLSLTGIPSIIKVFDDIEKGKLRNVDFLECHACEGGCIGGNLTVENHYVARSKILYVFAGMDKPGESFTREIEERYPTTDFSPRAPIKPRMVPDGNLGLIELVRRKKRTEEILRALPGLNCGLCGAPACRAHAEDVASGRAEARDCVFLGSERIDQLRQLYLRDGGKGTGGQA